MNLNVKFRFMLPAVKVGGKSIYNMIIIIYFKIHLQSYLYRYFGKVYIVEVETKILKRNSKIKNIVFIFSRLCAIALSIPTNSNQYPASFPNPKK